MNELGNIIWVVFGGALIALMYILSGIILCLTIIGIPFGIQVMKLSFLALLPFGKAIGVRKGEMGFVSLLMNVIWILVGGFWIGIAHLILGVIFYITIIGIPFGKQHFKLTSLAIAPFGRNII